MGAGIIKCVSPPKDLLNREGLQVALRVVIIALTGDRLTGAVVRAGTSSIGSANRVCGSAVSATLALERRAFLDFVCDPPLSAKYVSVDIPQIRITKEQLCEVTVEEATPGPC